MVWDIHVQLHGDTLPHIFLFLGERTLGASLADFFASDDLLPGWAFTAFCFAVCSDLLVSGVEDVESDWVNWQPDNNNANAQVYFKRMDSAYLGPVYLHLPVAQRNVRGSRKIIDIF